MALDRVFIVHHGLVDRHAHYFGEALGWAEAWRARGIAPRFYIHRNALAEIVEALGARPVFPYASDAQVETDPRCQQLSDFLFLGVRFSAACKALEEDGVGGDDLVIVPFASERDVFGAALWLERLAPMARPVLAFTFMLAIRPSGVFSEAVGYGIVPVVAERTWAADQLAAGWGAGITFPEFSADAMVEALVTATDDFSALKARAALSKQSWRQSQSTAALLGRILAQARLAMAAQV